ncbi:hypothetical protein [Vibrio diabolicus]|uniref:hypothetical protein n=1 Tax=Vibrio diabolicus TaxID=50719 RepID=UPI00215DE7C4|nr:hypothetical protein [Vibrio diabolicus]MCS0305988.1 hypothetical protein [Vibrio diabolicus]MCS0404659.1 hypothetical protein [Vibrio diabolicus]
MNIRTSTIYTWLYSVLVLSYIYSVNFKFLSLDTSKITWLAMLTCLFIYLIFSKEFRFYFLKQFYRFKSFLVFGFLFIVLVFLGLFNNASNFTLAYYTIIYLVDYLPVSFFLCYLFSKKNVSSIDVIVKAGVIQASLIIGMLLIPSFKHAYSSLVSISGNILDYYAYRNVGITGFANYTVGTTQAMILCLFFLDLIRRNDFNIKNIFFCILIFFSAAFSSRSSLVVIVMFFFFFFLPLTKTKYFWEKILPFLFLSFLGLFISLFLILNNREILNDSFVLKWAIEPILNYVDYGELSTKSSDTISSFYFYPGDKTFLFGDWHYVNLDGTYYKSVDAGYMRMMLYMGMPVSIIVYVSFIISFVFVSFKYQLLYYKIFSLFFIFIILLLHYKGNAFVDASGMFKLYFIYFASTFLRCKYEK